MPQRVDPSGLADPSLVFGALVDARRRLTAHRALEGSSGEQPVPGSVTVPVLAQQLEQPRRQGDVAVLVALALVDPQTHPGGVDIGDLQSTQLAGTKPRGVGGHEHGAVLEVGGDGEQAHQFVVTEALGQRGGDLGAGHIEVGVRQPEGDTEEKAHAVANGVAGAPVQPVLLVKEQEVVLDFWGGDLVGATAIVPGESGDRAQVRRHSAVGESANGHVVDQALTQRCQGSSPLRCERVPRHTNGQDRRCSWHPIPGNVGRRESKGAMNSTRAKASVHRLT